MGSPSAATPWLVGGCGPRGRSRCCPATGVFGRTLWLAQAVLSRIIGVHGWPRSLKVRIRVVPFCSRSVAGVNGDLPSQKVFQIGCVISTKLCLLRGAIVSLLVVATIVARLVRTFVMHHPLTDPFKTLDTRNVGLPGSGGTMLDASATARAGPCDPLGLWCCVTSDVASVNACLVDSCNCCRALPPICSPTGPKH